MLFRWFQYEVKTERKGKAEGSITLQKKKKNNLEFTQVAWEMEVRNNKKGEI